MELVCLDPRMNELVDVDAVPERIASGFMWAEGPVWHPHERHLIFSDMRGDTMYRWTEAGGTEVFRRPSADANGNSYDPLGRLVTCEHIGRRLSRTDADGSIETIVSDYEGRRLNSPNDVVCLPNGDVIFTDPPYGLRQSDGSFGPQEIPFQGVYRVSAADGSLEVLVDDFGRPNGLVVSDDGRNLYVADTLHGHVRVFDLGADGRASNGRMFVETRYREMTGRPDGMKFDSLGNLYVAQPPWEGIGVYSPDATLLGFIGLGEPPANLTWGDDDWQTMFVTASTSVYQLRMKVPGQRLFMF